ncbi:MAG: hypothetical protein CVV64_11220 [Candidatus Wallbacteria bacterium HGW-Wallbacteria-1]|jgi:parvulin-like peptidyl-prolyl isomerase|uniref:Periplasmic chaperone PpiD n=1 Tax=Candidatus Wallbacteria bacterium HGW-Wallbacteria-1 TaxID=2013854 RepID=A0A2N1PP10_9BACT|nr:MAG: hypothetical protein CVV64_11220 [Candidatus Wallbacteria bacterium HGW-Wallbacteria-1]
MKNNRKDESKMIVIANGSSSVKGVIGSLVFLMTLLTISLTFLFEWPVQAARGFRFPGHALLARTDGGIKITRDDFLDRLRKIAPEVISGEVDENMIRRHLQLYLDEMLLLKEARNKGLHMSESFISFQTEFRRKLLAGKLLRTLDRELFNEPPAREDELNRARTQYEFNINRYQRPMMTRISFIMTPIRDQADKALERLRRGEDFGTVARECSKASNAVKGGEGGYIYPVGSQFRGFSGNGPVPDAVRARAFSLETGETSGLIDGNDGGWYIVRRGDTRPALDVSFDQVRDLLIYKIRHGQKAPKLVRMERVSEKVREIIADAEGYWEEQSSMTIDNRDQRIVRALAAEAEKRGISANEEESSRYVTAATNYLCALLLRELPGNGDAENARKFLENLRKNSGFTIDESVVEDFLKGLRIH